MSKIADAFKKGKAFIPFITCGDPDLETTAKAIRAAAESGADMIELGIPFSDPTAEGPVIQSANIRALAGGVTTDKIFAFAAELRRDVTIPIVFMTYANVVFSYGGERFMSRCKEVGIDGVILLDLPFEEKKEFTDTAKKYGIDIISLISPASADRASMIAEEAEGFIYIVSDSNPKSSDISRITEMIRAKTEVPCAVSFSNKEQVGQMAAVSDGAIADLEIIRIIEQYGRDSAPYVSEYVKAMKEAVLKV